MDLPLLKIDIPNNLEPQKPVVYSRYLQSALYKVYLGTCILQHGTDVKIEHL